MANSFFSVTSVLVYRLILSLICPITVLLSTNTHHGSTVGQSKRWTLHDGVNHERDNQKAESVFSRAGQASEIVWSIYWAQCSALCSGGGGGGGGVSYWKIMRYSGRWEISADHSQITQAPSQN